MKDVPLEQYANFQPLVRKDIEYVLTEWDKQNQYKVTQIPSHTHNGVDSLPVAYSTLDGVQFHSIIRTVVLTPAEIKALNTSPYTLIPQPGARSVIIVEGITARIVYSGTAYTGANALEFRYTDGSGAKVTADIANTFINSTSSVFAHAPAVTATFTPVPGDSGTNGRIVISVPTANPATGNSQILFTVKYRIVSFNI